MFFFFFFYFHWMALDKEKGSDDDLLTKPHLTAFET
jgi:hypothetical protein